MEGFKKITYEMYEILDSQEIIEQLPTNIKTIVEREIMVFTTNLLSGIIDCESPIEMLMSLALEDLYEREELGIMGIFKQEEIVCGETKYRADFLIPVSNPKTNKEMLFVVECDGHEFHQKTKAQVERDNIRNRNMTSNGYIVIRFSGSEVFKNSYKCAREVIDTIKSKVGDTNE